MVWGGEGDGRRGEENGELEYNFVYLIETFGKKKKKKFINPTFK
jgi:hypothetical protein